MADFQINLTQKQQRTHDLTGLPMLRIKKASQLALRGFVAIIELHSNQMWKDLREFYSLVGVLEQFLKIKKTGY